jgi:hypothetical protein
VEASSGANAVDLDVKLYDDDDQYLSDDPLYPSLLTLQSPPLPALPEVGFFINAAQSKFGEAYITLVNANVMGWNTTVIVPFKRYEYAFLLGGTVVFDDGNLQLKGADRPDFWAFSVAFGYQAGSDIAGVPSGYGEDGDPDTEEPLRGVTPKAASIFEPFGYCVIYVEAIRDHAFSQRPHDPIPPHHFNLPEKKQFLTGRYLQRLYGVIAHEIGHAPGRQSENADHEEDNVMQKEGAELDSTVFSPASLKRFRSVASWTQ